MGSKVLFMLPALALALLALVLAMVGLSRDPAEGPRKPQQAQSAPADEAPRYRYWVVMQAAKVGDTLAQENLAVVTSPSKIPNAISADKPLDGKPVQRLVAAGELVTSDMLEASGGLTAALPAGFRAMAISVNEVSTAGELLQPGDLVDVISAFKRSTEGKPVALVMLHRVPVLAVHGSLTASDGKDDARRRNNTVVLSVPEKQVPALMLASSEGTLRLAVVGGADREMTTDTALADNASQAVKGDEKQSLAATEIKPFYFDDFFPDRKKPVAAPAAPRPSPGQRVQIFEGSQARSAYVR